MLRRIFYILMFSTLAFSSTFAQSIWQGPSRVCGGNCIDFVINPVTGNLHVAAGNQYHGLIYTVLDSVGNQISEEVLDSTAPEGNLNWGPTIVLDSDGYAHIVYKYSIHFNHTDDGPWEPDYNIGYLRQNSEGWSSRIKVASNVWRGYVLRMDIDSEDRIHLGISSVKEELLGQGPYGNITYYRIVDGSINMTQELLPDVEKQYRFDSRFEFAVTPDDNVHLLIGNPDYTFGVKHITYLRSTDHGDSWHFMEDLFAGDADDRGGAPDLFAAANGDLHMVYGTLRGSDNRGNIRYIRYKGNFKNQMSTVPSPYIVEGGWGNASVASTANSDYIAVAYFSHRGYGSIYATISDDGGQSWSEPERIIKDAIDNVDDGRNTHLVRAHKNHIYLIFPAGNNSYLRYIRNLGDSRPIASLGGDYTAFEGDVVTLDGSASFDEGTNPGITKYSWEWTGEGVADTITASAQIDVVFKDDLIGQLILEVTDNAGLTDRDTVSLTIYNAAPSVEITGLRSIGEGDTLRLGSIISDQGVDDTHTLSWTLGDGKTDTASQVWTVYADESSRIIELTVVDDDGLTGSDTIHVTVANLPPTADAGGPYSVAPNEAITLIGTGTDPGTEDVLTGHWDLDGNGIFETAGFSTNISFVASGEYFVYFEVRDGDGGSHRVAAQVNVDNAAPVIAGLVGQTILEGQTFLPVELDNFVSDNEHSTDRLSWTVTGYTDLLINISDTRILTVAVPDTEWAGQETLTLIVSDPVGMADTTDVEFEVVSINDRPMWMGQYEFTLNEDDTLQIPMSYLRTLVTDADHEPDQLTFSIAQNQFIDGGVDGSGNQWLFWGAPNWYGQETVHWIVTDAADDSSHLSVPITIESIPDSPNPFYLLSPMNIDSTAWPDSIRFNWFSTTDPDSNDSVFYVLYISSQGGSATWSHTSSTLLDTTYLLEIPENTEVGLYFWWIEAVDVTGNTMESASSGTILIRNLSIVADDVQELQPLEYRLLQNHPNPFNPQTNITYHLPEGSHVYLSVYNMLGQEIRKLVDEYEGAGAHTVSWNGCDNSGNLVPTGVYLCRFSSGGQVFMRKMMLMQ
ncbi:T9SS type A sorting domain-containing protein [bacterium]|nr:T9SS type A sorting domain-containing protein [bacterium]